MDSKVEKKNIEEDTTEFGYVNVAHKNFIGIGKMTFNSEAEWNIPHLHFMVDKTADGNFEATLLEFGLVSWSESLNDSITSLVKQTRTHIITVMEKSGFEEFIKEVDDHVMDGYWREYRKIDFKLAQDGKDLSHEMDSRFMRALRAMISEDTKNCIKKIARDNTEEIMKIASKIYYLIPSSLTYRELKEAA